MNMFSRLVGQCHVGESNRKVIKYVISKLKHGYGTWTALDQKTRKDFMREIISYHKENQDLYCAVQSGRFGE